MLLDLVEEVADGLQVGVGGPARGQSAHHQVGGTALEGLLQKVVQEAGLGRLLPLVGLVDMSPRGLIPADRPLFTMICMSFNTVV